MIQIPGMSVATIEAVAPILLNAVATAYPQAGPAIGAIELLFNTLQQAQATGVLNSDQASATLNTAVTGLFNLHNSAVKAS